MPVMPALLSLLPAHSAGRAALEKAMPEGEFAALLVAQLLPLHEASAPLAEPDDAAVAAPDAEPPEASPGPLQALPAQLDPHALQQLVSQLPVTLPPAGEGAEAGHAADAPQVAPAPLHRGAVPVSTPGAVVNDAAQIEAPSLTAPVAIALPASDSQRVALNAERHSSMQAAPALSGIHESVPLLTAEGLGERATLPAGPPVMRATLAGTPGSEPWQHAMGEQLKVMVHQGLHRAELKLHPEDLGTLQVSLRVQQDQAQITVLSDHPQVRAALEATLPQLRSALAESGIQLGESSVGNGNFSQQQTAQAPAAPAGASAGAEPTPGEEAVMLSIPSRNGAINTFV